MKICAIGAIQTAKEMEKYHFEETPAGMETKPLDGSNCALMDDPNHALMMAMIKRRVQRD